MKRKKYLQLNGMKKCIKLLDCKTDSKFTNRIIVKTIKNYKEALVLIKSIKKDKEMKKRIKVNDKIVVEKSESYKFRTIDKSSPTKRKLFCVK